MATRRNKATLMDQTPPRALAQKTAETDAHATFGIVVDVNGKELTLAASDLSNLTTQGIEFELPAKVEVGTYGDLSKFVKDNLKVNLPDLETLPSPFAEIGDQIAKLTVSIEKFHIKVPKKTTTDQETNHYTLRMFAEWKNDSAPKIGPISVKGFRFGVTNEP